MTELMRRRRALMGAQSGGGPLFPLVPGSALLMTNGYIVTTTKDGHIVRYNETRQTPNKYANLRNIALYKRDIPSPTWFTLRQGQTVTFEASGLSVMELHLFIANTNTSYVMLTNSSKTMTFVVSEDVDIGCVGFRTTVSVNGGTTYEFDIALYVDGKRYF